MGTRGAFGVIIGEQEKIGYNQFDSYPDGYGIENLSWLRAVDHTTVRRLATAAKVVSNDRRPSKEEQEFLALYADTNVSEQSLEDWYCLLHKTHGSIDLMLQSGYIEDCSSFPLDSLFCEWAYIVDLDEDVFEVYQGFVKGRPTLGRWAGRPTPEEDAANFQKHLDWCEKEGREPWFPETAEYGAVGLIARWRLDALPSDEEFLAQTRSREEAEV